MLVKQTTDRGANCFYLIPLRRHFLRPLEKKNCSWLRLQTKNIWLLYPSSSSSHSRSHSHYVSAIGRRTMHKLKPIDHSALKCKSLQTRAAQRERQALSLLGLKQHHLIQWEPRNQPGRTKKPANCVSAVFSYASPLCLTGMHNTCDLRWYGTIKHK
jgi:hypothetical protein